MDSSTVLPPLLSAAIVGAALLILWSIWGDRSNLRAVAKVISAASLAAIGVTSQLNAEPPGWWTIAWIALAASFILWASSISADTLRPWLAEKAAEVDERMANANARADEAGQEAAAAEKAAAAEEAAATEAPTTRTGGREGQD